MLKLIKYPKCQDVIRPYHNESKCLIQTKAPVDKPQVLTNRYLAGVAAPASLLATRARGCNEIYHLKYRFVCKF